MPMPASNPRVRNLVEDDIAHLLFIVNTHERLRQADDLIAKLRHPRPLARTIKHEPPLGEPVGVHELASELVYVQKIHASSLGPASDTFRTLVNSCGWVSHERLLWRRMADSHISFEPNPVGWRHENSRAAAGVTAT